jgi:8-oxo-dGTP pyrophosphatase MutT (NUDIX family)
MPTTSLPPELQAIVGRLAPAEQPGARAALDAFAAERYRVTRGPFLAVRAIIRDGAGRVLVLKRADGDVAGGLWCLPGGKVDFGETVEAALEKEILEETSLVCEETRFLFYQDSMPRGEAAFHFVNLYFECRVRGDLSLNEESSDIRWLAPADLAGVRMVFRNDEGLARYWEEASAGTDRRRHVKAP